MGIELSAPARRFSESGAAMTVGASVSDNMTTLLRNAILSGEIAQGTRLVEGAIAERYKISRGPVRTAIANLETRGLLIREARRATQVIDLSTVDIEKLYDFRIALELYAVHALERCSAVGFSRLESAALNLETTLTDGDPRYVRAMADVGFHGVLINLPENEYLSRAWSTLEDRLILIVSQIQRTLNDNETLLERHARILAALMRRDWNAAANAVKSHAQMALEVLLRG